MSDFDWVSARAACSVAKVFEQLRLGVESDVKLRNALRPPDAGYGFDVASAADGISAFTQGPQIARRVVRFTRTERGISVSNEEGKILFDATLTLNDAGECRVKVQGREREFWQFRQMALETLFFEV